MSSSINMLIIRADEGKKKYILIVTTLIKLSLVKEKKIVIMNKMFTFFLKKKYHFRHIT